jgi:membrane-associated protein
MDYILWFVDFVLHLDVKLDEIVQDYEIWTYAILFVILFCETGLVVTPFLPGDSLLFAVGTLAARENNPLNVWVVIPILAVAAILGDTVNYWAGHYVGPKVFKKNTRLLNRKHLERTHRFYEKHGGKTIIIARFLPIIRTFAPFVAGIGRMAYRRFVAYNVIGGIIWPVIFVLAGYFFGNIEVVKKNFTLVIMAIIVISVIPAVVEFLRARFGKADA